MFLVYVANIDTTLSRAFRYRCVRQIPEMSSRLRLHDAIDGGTAYCLNNRSIQPRRRENRVEPSHSIASLRLYRFPRPPRRFSSGESNFRELTTRPRPRCVRSRRAARALPHRATRRPEIHRDRRGGRFGVHDRSTLESSLSIYVRNPRTALDPAICVHARSAGQYLNLQLQPLRRFRPPVLLLAQLYPALARSNELRGISCAVDS